MNREAFEAAMREHLNFDDAEFELDEDGAYDVPCVALMFDAWSARDAEVAALKARVRELEAYECFNCGMDVQI